MHTRFFAVLIAVSLMSLMGCQSQPEQIIEKSEQAQKEDNVWSWDYEGPKGPEKWGALNPKYKTCEQGQLQSPINLVWQLPKKGNPLSFNYKPGQATVINAGYTFRLELTPSSSIRFQDQDYILEKVEFRTPSEHRLSGNEFPLEVQFYHRSSNGLRQVILSTLAITGRSSESFDLIWQKAAVPPKFQSSESFVFDPSAWVPDRMTLYNYQGSLPHLPCHEGVEWVVLNTPIQISSEQLTRLRTLFPTNNRPIQPLNDRRVINY